MKRLAALFYICLILLVNNFALLSAYSIDDLSEQECIVALNELMPNPAGPDAGNEWIELFNCTDEEINLDGYYMQDKSGGKQSLESLIIEPNGYLVIFPNFSLNQSDEEIYLFSNDELIDYFAYATSKEDQSWARDPDGVGEWTDNIPPSPGEANSISYSEKIKINEIYPTPETGENEWLELFNDSEEPVDLTSWILADKSSSQVLGNITIEPKSYLILEAELLKITLNNSGDVIQLIDPNGNLIMSFEYLSTLKAVSNIIIDQKIVQTKAPTKGTENIFISLDDCFYGIDTSTIADFKSSQEGIQYILNGIITATTDDIYSDRIYIQDETGGIQVKLPKDFGIELKRNDSIKISGNIDEYYKEKIILIESPQCFVAQGTGQSETRELETTTIDNFEGDLVQIRGEVIKNGSSYEVSYQNTKVKLKLAENLNKLIIKGDTVQITGILTRYLNDSEDNPNYRLTPRDSSDIKVLQTAVSTTKTQTKVSSKTSTSRSLGKVAGKQDQKLIDQTIFGTPKNIQLENYSPRVIIERKAQTTQTSIILPLTSLSSSLGSFLLFFKKFIW